MCEEVGDGDVEEFKFFCKILRNVLSCFEMTNAKQKIS